MVVLRGAQAVGLGSHLSHLIYIYKLKITKYMYMAPYAHETQAVAPDDPPPPLNGPGSRLCTYIWCYCQCVNLLKRVRPI